MGLPTFARDYLKNTYLDAFSFELKFTPTVCVYDLMKDLKYMPEDGNINTMNDAIMYLVGKIRTVLFKTGSTIRTIVVLVDRKPPIVKKMVTHTKRYKGKNVYNAKDGPFLPVNGADLIPRPWIQFAGNYKLLQRELYPRLFNAFMDSNMIRPKPGQTIILHGFPGTSEWVTVYKQQAYALETNSSAQVKKVHTWRTDTELPLTKAREKADKDLYNRIYLIEEVPP